MKGCACPLILQILIIRCMIGTSRQSFLFGCARQLGLARVISFASALQVFRLPNPWTFAIMNVLAELHREPEMKLNLKFEIEVLCKNLQIDINVSY